MHLDTSRRVASLSLLAALATAASGCGEDDTLNIELVLGHESDALSRDPAVTRVEVTATSLVSDFSAVASAAPGEVFDLGEVPSDEIYYLSAKGFAADAAAVGGRTLAGLSLTAGARVKVFLQRSGAWARPPSELPASRSGGAVSAASERYVLIAGGSPEGDANPLGMELYDLLTLDGGDTPTLPFAPRTMLERASVLLILGDGTANWVDLSSGANGEPELPPGLASFADVEGGAVVEGEGATFVVGATRADPPTAAVLKVDSSGYLSLTTLTAPRAGASATWVRDVGLVVAGGNAEAAGVEIVRTGQVKAVALPYPPDATQFAGASVGQDGRVLLFGGESAGQSAPSRRIDPFCNADCAAELLSDPDAGIDLDAPVPLHVSSQWNIADGVALAIAEDPAGPATRTFRLDLADPAKPTLEELLLREPRSGAVAAATPNGMLMLLGGRLADGGGPALRPEIYYVE